MLSEPPVRVVLDRRTKRLVGGRLVGGDPLRVVRLSDRGSALLDDLLAGQAAGRAAHALAARLVDDGIAHPVRPDDEVVDAITVVVPVRDDASGLERCLTVLRGLPVLVVDDGSTDTVAVADVAARNGAHVVWHAVPRGPAAARNTGLAQVTTPLVAFVDADAQISAAALRTLARWFADPQIGAVAPRVRPAPAAPTTLARFLDARSPLDLGPDAAGVRPWGRVSYVPSTALVCRRTALGAGFDEDLRYGEDVDLVWRTIDAGWTVRYDPDVVALHREPTTWLRALRRRERYGTAAGPLARRHGARLAPAVTTPLPALAAVLLLARRRAASAAVTAAGVAILTRRLAGAGVPPAEAIGIATPGFGAGLLSLSRATTQLAAPVLVTGGPVRSAALLAAAPLAERRRRRPALGPVRWTAACIADDVAYGLGVWRGALQHRAWSAVAPVIRRPATPRLET